MEQEHTRALSFTSLNIISQRNGKIFSFTGIFYMTTELSLLYTRSKAYKFQVLDLKFHLRNEFLVDSNPSQGRACSLDLSF